MKENLRHRLLTWSLVAGSVSMLFLACDNEDHKIIPTVVTSTNITEVTLSSAKGGGEITSNGNATITASGLVYSNIIPKPTTSEDKTAETATSGSFTSTMQGLASGKKYYVRAYATNQVGTGYGDVVTFTTGNSAPTATEVSIDGNAQVSVTLTAKYKYNDAENDEESGTTFQWYIADVVSGTAVTNEMAVSGATSSTYTVLEEQFGKFFRISVTPNAATGTKTGVEVKSLYIDGEPTTVPFTYNNASVTYGIIRSAKTGRKWLDRNLGSGGIATASNDYANYGDLFQWGRRADDHQLINRTGLTSASGVNGATSSTDPFEYANTDQPGNKFIIIGSVGADPYDWRKPQNNALWQGVNGTNNPCPSGWRLATQTEWDAEELQNTEDAFNKLKLPLTGTRWSADGNCYLFDTGYYWASTLRDPSVQGGASNSYSTCTRLKADSYLAQSTTRGEGMAVRCIKDDSN